MTREQPTRYVRDRRGDHIHVETMWNGTYQRTLCGSVLQGEVVDKPKRICRACARAQDIEAFTGER